MFTAKTLGEARVTADSDLGLDSFTVCVTVPSSSRDEPGDRIGVTHMLEHLVMSAPADSRRRSFCDWVSEVGGQANAMTTKETVVYWARTPPDSAIDCVLRLTRAIADPAFPDDLCASERRVVLQELLSAAADPADVATERFYAQLFDSHELGRPVGGTADDFPDFTPRELLSWHRRGLTARPIAVSLVGPDELMGEAIDAVAASRLAQSVSSSQDKRKAPRLQESRRVEGFRPAADTDYICLAVGGSGASRRHQLQPAYEVLAALVGGIPGSLLYERLRKELGAAYQLQTINTAFSDCGAWRVLAGTTPAEAAAVEKAIFACLDQVASGRLPEGAFEFAIAQCRGAVLIDNEDPVSRAYLTGARACDELPGESPVRRMESAFKTIDADMVAESAHRVLETYVAVSSWP